MLTYIVFWGYSEFINMSSVGGNWTTKKEKQKKSKLLSIHKSRTELVKYPSLSSKVFFTVTFIFNSSQSLGQFLKQACVFISLFAEIQNY